MVEKDSGVKVRRGVYLLPNMLTLLGMFAAFYAIIAAIHGRFTESAIAILVGLVLDGLDGRVARMVNAQTDFGAQLDSLSDMVAFGLSPALILYHWSLFSLGKPGWLVAFLYVACTALRLARFNVTTQVQDKRYFQGLSTTMAAPVVASLVWCAHKYDISGSRYAFWVLILSLSLSLLKVSSVPYRSFKDLQWSNRVAFSVILLFVFVVLLISINPPVVFLLLSFGYVLSGPLEWLCKHYAFWRKK